MKFDNFEDWNFSIEEVSNNVYQITAIDIHGRKVEMTGTNVEKLISDCKVSVLKIDLDRTQ